MQYNIKIQPSGVHFKSGNCILDDALVQNIPLEHSCKSGQCGACASDLISGTVENESGDIVNSGSILTCQSKALSDLELRARYYPELAHIKEKTLPCRVSSIRYATDNIVVLTFRFPPSADFDFLPGQYVDLNFKGVTRSYSIANAKSDTKELELHIRKVESGQMSELIFGGIEENQLMRLEGPKGTFYVHHNDKPLLFLATGTGIAPIKAIVEQLLKAEDIRSVYVYWGMRYQNELYCTELKKYMQENKHIHFVPVLSREDYDGCRHGYVQDAVMQDFETLKNMDVYACGSPNMIESAKDAFVEHKELLLNAFYSDAFTFTH